MPYLSFIDAVGAESVVDLADGDGDGALIGRVSQCDVVVPKPFVSRRHARVVRRDERWHVEDLTSRHGTFVAGERVAGTRPLEDGDVIVVGDASIRFRVGLPPRGAATSGATGPIPRSPIREKTSSGAPNPLAGDVSVVLAAQATAAGIVGSILSPASPDMAASPGAAAQLMALLRVATELRQCSTIAEACGLATRHAIASTRADRGVLALREDGGTFVPKAQLDAAGVAASFEWFGDFVDRAVREKLALVGRAQAPDGTVRAMLCAPLWEGRAGSERVLGWLYLDVDEARQFQAADLDLVSAISFQLAAEVTRLTLSERVRSEESRRASLSRFLSTDVVRLIEQTDTRAQPSSRSRSPLMEVREQEVTILFADIQGFTRLSERLAPTDVKAFLDGWLEEVTEVIVDHHGGTLDKYIGDGVMALFGAPFSQGTPADAKSAIRAALSIRDVAERLRKKRPDAYADLQVRIGLNTGKVVAGMMGSQRRAEYSVIGDAVNIASRLEAECDPGRILVGEGTWAAVGGGTFAFEAAGERVLRGRERPVRCWWVLRPSAG